MAEDPKTFIRNAEEAEANAAKATEHHVKRQFLDVAEQWRQLAKRSLGRSRQSGQDAS